MHGRNTARETSLQAANEACVCCGSEYRLNGDQCLECKAPLQLSRTVRARGGPARFVPVLGASGAGKTVFLGMLLDLLNNGQHGLRGLASGGFSVTLQEESMAALERRRFPEKTASEADQWRWVHCEVSSPRKPRHILDLVTPDLAGEAIALELERPGAHLAIQAVVHKAQAVLILCDSVQVRDAGLREDVFAVKLILYLYNAHQRPENLRRRQPLPLPVAFVFTKADGCPEARNDPLAFATANLPRLVQFLKSDFAHYRFFASSVVGSTATLLDGAGCHRTMPLHIEPHGILEPLAWLMDQNRRN